MSSRLGSTAPTDPSSKGSPGALAVAPLVAAMPASFETPLLTVDLEQMHRIDTQNVENLFGLWTGYRYENMSWRLWGRQVSGTDPPTKRIPSVAQVDRTPRQSTKDLPQLSSSVESASSEEYECVGSDPARSSPVTITGSAQSPPFEHVSGSSRSKGRPSSPGALGRMVLSINETKVYQRGDMPGLAASVTAAIRPVLKTSDILPSSQKSCSSPQHASPKHAAPRASQSSASTVPMSSPESSLARSNTCGSETSAEYITAPDVVRGFTPSSISSHRMSQASSRPDPVPIKSSMRQHVDPAAVKPAKFMLGGSSEEESSSLEDQMSLRKPGMMAPTSSAKDTHAVKQASFSDHVETRLVPNPADEDAIASDDEDEDEDDDVDESAIEEEEDEDDEEEWDDYSDGEEPPAPPQFGRIDSTSRLTSRRSLLTTGLHQSEREHAMLGLATSNAAAQARRSRQASSNGPSLGTSVDEEIPMEMQGIKITRTKPPLGSPSGVQHPPALSPRTTRRNMLATELTESLRKHLLWERQQKNTTANAHLKRRHTSHDVANLNRYPDHASPEDAASKNNSWNSVFDTGLGEYHSRGW